MVSNGGPKIHQKPSKIHPWTPKGPPECTLATNDSQSNAKVPPQDLKMLQKWFLKTSKNQ